MLPSFIRGFPRGVMVKAMDYGIVREEIKRDTCSDTYHFLNASTILPMHFVRFPSAAYIQY